MRAIQYAAPESLPDAVALLARYGAGARVLAGGTDLMSARCRKVLDCASCPSAGKAHIITE